MSLRRIFLPSFGLSLSAMTLFTKKGFFPRLPNRVPFTSGPIGRAGRLCAALSVPGMIPGCCRGWRRAPVPLPSDCGGGRPDLRPDPLPRWDGGSWPDSHSGGGGTGLGGEVGGWPVAAFFFFAGAGDGTTDSNLALLFTGSPSSPPPARSAISFLAATLLALEVRCTPSPAQMLVPSTVVRSWGRDSPEPKKT